MNFIESLKRHWLAILITICATCLAVYVVAMLIIIFAAPRTPATFANTQQASVVDLKIKGNRNSKIYHLPGCPNYNDIAERNIVWFKTKEEAEAAGYRMAKNC